MNEKQSPDTLASLDAGKRETLRKLVIGSAYVVPAVASFSMNEVSLLRAESYSNNTHRP